MHVVLAADAPHFHLPGIRFTGMASPSRGSQGVCAWQITVDAGLRSPESHTLDRDEIFMVTSGVLRLSPDATPLRPGDTAVVPAGTPIQLSNPGDTEATAYVVIPAGFSARMADGTSVGTPPWAL